MADRVPLDFDPPVRRIRGLLLGITDEHLAAPTPCPSWSVGDLLAHLLGLGFAFIQAARKRPEPAPREPSVADLPEHWRTRLPQVLDELADAWRDTAAWEGTTTAGGVTMPAAAMGVVAANELTMHGWDLARATGQEYAADPRLLEHLAEFLAQNPPEGVPGLFGPRIPTDDEASLLEQTVALSGRDPHWRPTTAAH